MIARQQSKGICSAQLSSSYVQTTQRKKLNYLQLNWRIRTYFLPQKLKQSKFKWRLLTVPLVDLYHARCFLGYTSVLKINKIGCNEQDILEFSLPFRFLFVTYRRYVWEISVNFFGKFRGLLIFWTKFIHRAFTTLIAQIIFFAEVHGENSVLKF